MSTLATRQKGAVVCRFILAVALMAVCLAGAPTAGAEVKNGVQGPAGAMPCDLSDFQIAAPAGTTITSVSVATTPVAYCKVVGFVSTTVRGPNNVNFLLALPDVFNGRYILNAQGGSAGFVPSPPASQLSAGYAIAGTDEGNQSGGLDYRFAVNRAQAFDWDHLGVHVVTVATEQLTKGYYRQSHIYTYIAGCSGGGRSGVQEASLYPHDYDGVLAGAPGINPDNILFFGQLSQFLLRHPDAWVPPATLAVIESTVLTAWDASDGAVDGLVWEPWTIKFDPASLGILTDLQLTTVRMIMKGINDFGQVYPGFTVSNPTGWSSFLVGLIPPQSWAVPTPTPPSFASAPAGFIVFDTIMRGLFGLNYNFVTQFDFANPRDIAAFEAKFVEVYPAARANPADLRNFKQAGDKILFWQGASDNAISINDTIRFYTQLADLEGGFRTTQTFARFFVAPGVLHCGGGPGPQDVPVQALDALTKWVEGGRAPKTLVVHSAPTAVQQRTFLLCPYPQVSVFKGGIDNERGLNVNDASNWNCRRSVPDDRS
jgi:Tannase and feruloyl esterase